MLVSVFQYMRLLGYPAHKISVLTTYNGQKALLRDVFERRCARHPAFGRPAKVCMGGGATGGGKNARWRRACLPACLPACRARRPKPPARLLLTCLPPPPVPTGHHC